MGAEHAAQRGMQQVGGAVVEDDRAAAGAVDAAAQTIAALEAAGRQRADVAGKLAGQRMSSAGFSFVGPRTFSTSGGSVFGQGTATVTLQSGAADADGLNPYRHRYHPDHAQGVAFSRAITLAFSSPPAGQPETALRGSYAESISGLYRSPVSVSGSFSLSRSLGPVTFVP